MTTRELQTKRALDRDERGVGRRQVIALGAAVLFGRVFTACSAALRTSSSASGAEDAGGADATELDTGVGASSADASAGGDASSATDASAATDATSAVDGASAAEGSLASWATGGTAAMTGKASYPNPFSDMPTTCAVSCKLTEGPCYSSQSVSIQDISYGYDGLPMRMYLRVLDESCEPVAGALVDVWHVGPTGKYSGDDSANEQIAFCTGNDSDFTSHLYFRGKQTTDANGIVFFDTCFPGWYTSRTIHVHMTISVGGQAYVTTQLGFDDALDDEIVASQPLYDARGKRDTTNATDTVLPATNLSEYLFQTERMSDGAMLAWQTLILRSALSETICSPAGAGGSPGGAPSH